jgi:spermidine synthase
MRVVAHARSERGDLHLCRRADGTLELRVNGIFVMDSVETRTERLLAGVALAALPSDAASVLVAGLGLGFTLAAVLDDPGVRRVHVVEIEPDLVRWHRTGVIPSPVAHPRGVLADPRVRVEVADVRDALSRLAPGELDAILLDVDNGPGYLVYDGNAAVYQPTFLRRCATALRPDGALAVWSADSSPDLLAAMSTAFARVEEVAVPVNLSARVTSYHVFLGNVGSGDQGPA